MARSENSEEGKHLMTRELSTRTRRAISEIRISDATSKVVDDLASDLDQSIFYPPETIEVSAQQLSIAADELEHALAPVAPDQLDTILKGLSVATMIQNQADEEHEAGFKILMRHLAHLPDDIIRAACSRYIDQPGKVFFPRNPGQILEFAKPMLFQRQRRAMNLRRLAQIKAERDEREREMAKIDEIPIDEIKSWRPSMRKTALDKGWISKAQYDQSGGGTVMTKPADDHPDAIGTKLFSRIEAGDLLNGG